MLVVVSYDVSTIDGAGRARLRRVAMACCDFGQRVQNSVFECIVDPSQWAKLRRNLLDLYHPQQDSLRFYYLGANWRKRVEHFGYKKVPDIEGPLIV